MVIFAVLLSAAFLLMLGFFATNERRSRRQASELLEHIERLQQALAQARTELGSKVDSITDAQRAALAEQSSGVRELSELLEGQVARLGEVGDALRSAADLAGERKGQQTDMLAEHFDTQRQIIEGQADEVRRLGELLEAQIRRLADLGDAWVKSAASAETYQDRQVQVMGDYAAALKAMAHALVEMEGALGGNAGSAAAPGATGAVEAGAAERATRTRGANPRNVEDGPAVTDWTASGQGSGRRPDAPP